METNIEKVERMLQPLLEGSDMFITSIRIKPTNNFKIFLDADSGFNVGHCASLNRKLYAAIEEAGMFPEGDFSLEVSSHGIDEPLANLRQYKKNIGRTVAVSFLEAEKPELTGVLKEADEEKIVLEEKFGKKKEVRLVEVPMAEIKETIVQVVF